MHLLLLDLHARNVIYSTYSDGPRDKFVISQIYEMVARNETKITVKNHQIGISINNGIIFAIIRFYGDFRIPYRECFCLKKIETEILYNFAEMISQIFSIDELNLLKKGEFKDFMYKLKEAYVNFDFIENDIIMKKLFENFFPKDTEIRLIGEDNSGITTIFYLWLGLTISCSYEDRQIPYQKQFNGKHVMLKKFNTPYGFERIIRFLLPKESYILYVVDSTNRKDINNNTHFHQILKSSEIEQKILIIANKQDLPDAISPKEIEDVMEFPTVGFSATAPNASLNLSQIISDFLKVDEETRKKFIALDNQRKAFHPGKEIIDFRGAKISNLERALIEKIEMTAFGKRKFILTEEIGPGTSLSFTVKGQKINGIRIYDCGLKSIPLPLFDLVSLEYLSIWNNNLTDIPKSLYKLSSLRKLRLGVNKLSFLPESIGKLEYLQTLDLYNNELTNLPNSLNKLSSLEILDLSTNKFQSLPLVIIELGSLKILGLEKNHLGELPQSIRKLKSLESLDVSENHLESLPESIGELHSLKELDIRNNYLETLPESIGKLLSLKKLDISGNPLKAIPKSIENLQSLQELEYSLEISHLIPEKLRNRLLLSKDSKNIVDIQKIFFSYENDLKVLQILKNFLDRAPPLIKRDFDLYLGAAIANGYFSHDIFEKEMIRRINNDFSPEIRDELNIVFYNYIEKEQLINLGKIVGDISEIMTEKLNNFYKNYDFLCEYVVWKDRIICHCKFGGEHLLFNEHVPYKVFKRILNRREDFVFDEYNEVDYDKSIWYDYVKEIWFKSNIQTSDMKNKSDFENKLIEEVIEIVKFIENPHLVVTQEKKSRNSKIIQETGYINKIGLFKVLLFNEDFYKEKIFSLIEERSRGQGIGISVSSLKGILNISENKITKYIEELLQERKIIQSRTFTYRKRLSSERSRI